MASLSFHPVFHPFPGRSSSPKHSLYCSSFHNKKPSRRKQHSFLNTLLQLGARENCHNKYINIWWVGFERQALKLCSVQHIEKPSFWVDSCLIPLLCKFPVPVIWNYWWAPRTFNQSLAKPWTGREGGCFHPPFNRAQKYETEQAEGSLGTPPLDFRTPFYPLVLILSRIVLCVLGTFFFFYLVLAPGHSLCGS